MWMKREHNVVLGDEDGNYTAQDIVQQLKRVGCAIIPTNTSHWVNGNFIHWDGSNNDDHQQDLIAGTTCGGYDFAIDVYTSKHTIDDVDFNTDPQTYARRMTPTAIFIRKLLAMPDVIRIRDESQNYSVPMELDRLTCGWSVGLHVDDTYSDDIFVSTVYQMQNPAQEWHLHTVGAESFTNAPLSIGDVFILDPMAPHGASIPSLMGVGHPDTRFDGLVVLEQVLVPRCVMEHPELGDAVVTALRESITESKVFFDKLRGNMLTNLLSNRRD